MTTTVTRPDVQQYPSIEVGQPKNRIWLFVAAAAVAAAILVGQVLATPGPDRSHEAVEFARQSALVTSDGSHLVAEAARQAAFGTVGGADASHEYAESSRMALLAPLADESFERNEANRQESLGG